MSSLKIALASINQIWEDKKTNLLLCEEFIKKASGKNVDLIIFPEMTLTGFSSNINFIAEDGDNSKTINQFQKLSKFYNIAILFGLAIKDKNKALNKSIFINKYGDILGEYSKIHPFSFSGEGKYFNAGDSLVVVNFMGHNIALTICYDLRFPELYSSLSANSDLIINIANWPSKRIDHWNALLKARAIENQIFIVGVNRIGLDGNGLKYIESSNVLNANGEKIEFIKLDEMQIYEIDKDWTKIFKDKFNTVNDRKNEFYKKIL